jgi:hypothetical protein
VSDPTEAAADAVTGAIIAAAVEPRADSAAPAGNRDAAACLNCGTALTGAFCAACGQPAHIHRSFLSLGHDILHGVFHFDTKLWRTLPELVLRPGRLTRRYIDGERAKFISPMALYLLSVFLMYAVFSFTGGAAPTLNPGDIPGGDRFQIGNSAAIDATQKQIDEIDAQLASPDVSVDQRAQLEARRAGLRTSLEVMEAMGRGDWANVERIQESVQDDIERARRAAAPVVPPEPAELAEPADPAAVDDGEPDGRLARGLREFNDNPGLMAYKLKTNGYKFSWMLVPLSIPFMWPLFFWRRNVKVYDHAVFVTYSISFMMLLLIFVSLLGLVGLGSGWIALLVMVAVPLHMYKQLRGTYASSRFGAFVRVWVLLFAALFVLSIYAVILLFIGALD